jgi:O-antigen/teichoic acid export membrane protein
MFKKFWLIKEDDIGKQSVFWNMMSSGLNSIVSMLLLWVVTLLNGVSDVGIFSLGFSTSQMMLTIGNYGMRNYQATDVTNKYSIKSFNSENSTISSISYKTTLFNFFASFINSPICSLYGHRKKMKPLYNLTISIDKC